MQNTYQYTKFFQPSEVYDKSFTDKLMKATLNLSINLKNIPLEDYGFIHMPFQLPYHKPYQDRYYNIIYIYAKLVGVKVMYKDILERSTTEKNKGLLIIGDAQRVHIMNHILNHFFRGHFQFEQWIKTSCKEEAKELNIGDIRIYASNLLESQLDTLYKFISKILEVDTPYEHRLENYILGQFKLDYKGYRTDDKLYYHTTSTKYHHRRMLL